MEVSFESSRMRLYPNSIDLKNETSSLGIQRVLSKWIGRSTGASLHQNRNGRRGARSEYDDARYAFGNLDFWKEEVQIQSRRRSRELRQTNYSFHLLPSWKWNTYSKLVVLLAARLKSWTHSQAKAIASIDEKAVINAMRLAIYEKWTRDTFDRLTTAHAKAGDFFLLTKDKIIGKNYYKSLW